MLCNPMRGHNIRETCLARAWARESRLVQGRPRVPLRSMPNCTDVLAARESLCATKVPFFERVTTLVLHGAFVDANQKHHFVAFGGVLSAVQAQCNYLGAWLETHTWVRGKTE